jgi:hypothetical protein
MAQADSNISTTAPVDSTRRRFLSQAAGVAAGGTVLALATITPGPSTAAPATPLDASKASHHPEVSNPDAEIIAAGKAFEPLLSKYLDVRFIWTRLAREARAEMEAKFPPDDFEGLPGKHQKWIFHGEVRDRNGCSNASDRLSAIREEMEPIADSIRSSAAETIEGLRAKTLVAIWDCQPVCATHEGGFEFSNERSHWSLFHAAVTVTGLSEMVSAIDIRLQIDAGIPQEGE